MLELQRLVFYLPTSHPTNPPNVENSKIFLHVDLNSTRRKASTVVKFTIEKVYLKIKISCLVQKNIKSCEFKLIA